MFDIPVTIAEAGQRRLTTLDKDPSGGRVVSRFGIQLRGKSGDVALCATLVATTGWIQSTPDRLAE